MEVLIARDGEAVAALAADVVVESMPTSGGGVLGLATGSSPLGLYRRLGELASEGGGPLAGLSGVALDE